MLDRGFAAIMFAPLGRMVANSYPSFNIVGRQESWIISSISGLKQDLHAPAMPLRTNGISLRVAFVLTQTPACSLSIFRILSAELSSAARANCSGER